MRNGWARILAAGIAVLPLLSVGCSHYKGQNGGAGYDATGAIEIVPTANGYDNLSLGIPGGADSIVDREGYALGYNETHEQAAWVVYRLTKGELNTDAESRTDNFRADPAIPTGSATPDDYRQSGYDRGHLAPAADMAFSGKTMSESFYMSNMSPQKPAFNRGLWSKLEKQVRAFAKDENDIYVVTGPVLPEDKSISIGKNEVTVPQSYYKVVYDLTPPQKMIGFVVPNENSPKPLRDFVVTVDAVEELTGLDFFPGLPEEKQKVLESRVDPDDWKWE